MSIAPHTGIVDFGTFTAPTASTDGIQGEVPQPLAGQEGYVLTGTGWASAGSVGLVGYQGTWNALTNTPTLTSSVGVQGYYYVVDVAGTTNLNGITDWQVGDWAIFNGSIWQKVDNTDSYDPANVAITGGTINNTVIGGTTPAAGTFTTLNSTSDANFGTGLANYIQARGASAGNTPYVSSWGSDTNVNLDSYTRGTGSFRFRTASSPTQLQITHTASAVNYVQVTGAATGGSPTISAQGSDSNASLNYNAKGTGQHFFQTAGANTFQINPGNGQINRLRVQSSATGFAPTLDTVGSDSNIALALRSTGTGAIDLAAGSRGVNISNGGTVTAITRTASGSGYTSFPTWTASAPTTAGGATASGTPTNMTASGFTVASGGTGYTVGNVLTVTGGSTGNCTLTVTAVSSGAVTAATLATTVSYTALPTNPVSVTGGTGSGATFNLTYGIGNSLTITNAGSGYVEQPTVTFSGGGGSGAAAYATVGSVTTIKSLGSSTTGVTNASLQFSTPALSSALTIRDIGGADTGILISPASGYTNITPLGAANATLMLASAGTNSIYFNTQGTSQTNQMRVAHTASAVNYVQVTGQVTGAGASVLGGILFTGSDTTVNGAITTKGTGYIAFSGGGATSNQAFRVLTTSAVSTGNLIAVQGSAAGSSPSIQAISGAGGSDTNINLTLTPKGTGRVVITNGIQGGTF